MKLIKDFALLALIVALAFTYILILLPDPEVLIYLKVITGIPVIGGLIGYIYWLYLKIRNED